MRTARCTWDFTVPIGWLRISAISGWLRPSMKRKVAAARRCIGNCSKRALNEHDLGILLDDGLRLCRSFVGAPQQGVGVGEGVERDIRGALAAQAVARHVQGDGVEPRLQTQIGSLFGRHFAERPVGTYERVLDDLFGVLTIARHAQGETVEATLVIVHDAFKFSMLGASPAGWRIAVFRLDGIADGT